MSNEWSSTKIFFVFERVVNHVREAAGTSATNSKNRFQYDDNYLSEEKEF
jgi:hypothetical protein